MWRYSLVLVRVEVKQLMTEAYSSLQYLMNNESTAQSTQLANALDTACYPRGPGTTGRETLV
jgi:hypothetical protein